MLLCTLHSQLLGTSCICLYWISCYAQDETACHLHPILCTSDATTARTPVTLVRLCSKKKKKKVFTTLIRPEEKSYKKKLVHSLAPALTLTLTLTLNHLANKLQQMTSTLFGLMYPTTSQRTINIFTTDKSVGVTQEPRAHYLLPYFNMGECSDSRNTFGAALTI